MRAKTIAVNGTVYDAKTGKPLRLERSLHPSPRKASSVHSRAQHSRTLNRKYVKKTITVKVEETPQQVQTARKTRSIKPAATHDQVKRFANDIAAPVKKPSAAPAKSIDIAPVQHPVAHKAIKKHAELAKKSSTSTPTAHKPSDILKKEAIEHATSSMAPRHAKKQVKQKKVRTPRRERLSLASAGLAFMLLSAYMTYLYMPNLSTRVAATQAGIHAEYPSYLPSGYRLSGPVAYQPGEVSMKFAANAGPATYTLTQKRSTWDSSAVLENYVAPKAEQNYSTTQANGLTIYNYENNSAWVNGGILYTIEGDAPLSGEQIQRIARSL